MIWKQFLNSLVTGDQARHRTTEHAVELHIIYSIKKEKVQKFERASLHLKGLAIITEMNGLTIIAVMSSACRLGVKMTNLVQTDRTARWSSIFSIWNYSPRIILKVTLVFEPCTSSSSWYANRTKRGREEKQSLKKIPPVMWKFHTVSSECVASKIKNKRK